MTVESAQKPAAAAWDSAHRLNLRAVQEDALKALYLATALAGLLALALTIEYPSAWRLIIPDLPLLLLTLPVYRLIRHYHARALLLLVFWCAAIVAGFVYLPGPAAACLLVLPVGAAQLFLGPWEGIVMAAAATGLLVVAGRAAGWPLIEVWLTGLGTIWGTTVVLWLGLRPLYHMMDWSWHNYEEARQERESARDVQADLKQANKDLADAAVQSLRLNQLLSIARKAAEDAEKAKAEFVANVSHELRTPLNMIVGFCDMMMRSPQVYGESVPSALLADLRIIFRNAQHLSDLIDDVLDLSQIETGHMALTRERVALGAVFETAVTAVRPLYDSKGLSLSVEMPADLPMPFCDRTRIREVVLNLLSNAGRFTERGGVELRAWHDGAFIVCSITDTGPGIAEEGKERLFLPFQQVDGSIRRRFGGTGLGLSISKDFVELHGGRIWLESAVGVGTTFYFSLPIDPPAFDPDSPLRWINPEWEYHQRTRPATAPRPRDLPRLVVVDRSQSLCRLLGRHLGDIDIEAVQTLPDAMAALAREPAQLLLCNTPSVSETLEAVNNLMLPEQTPAVICSVPGVDEAAAALGASDYLVKPIRAETLLATLDALGVTAGDVLVVDDEPDARRLFWRMLASTGRDYRVLTASDGEEALTLLETERPRVMLVDLMMEGMDGAALLAQRERDPRLQGFPIVVISARDPLGRPLLSSSLALTCQGGLAAHNLVAFIRAAGRILSQVEWPSSENVSIVEPTRQ
jgi:signal transduction histidine kinase/DNA-binding response OmpR family regulator